MRGFGALPSRSVPPLTLPRLPRLPSALRRRRAATLLMVLALAPPVWAATGSAAPAPLALSGIHVWLSPGSIAFSSAYVEAGDFVGVNVTVSSGGDAGANATLEFYVGDPLTAAPFASVPFTIGADTTAVVGAVLNTSDLVGIQDVGARISAISPPEDGAPSDNEAWSPLRVHHAVVDLLFQGSATFEINETYPHTGFVTVKDNAVLTVGPSGALSIVQRHDDEFDLLVEGNGTLRLNGGTISSSFALSVELRDTAHLIVEGAGTLTASVASSGAAQVTVANGRISAHAIALGGGSLSLSGASVDAGSIAVRAALVAVTASSVTSAATIEIMDCPSVTWTDVTIAVASAYGSAADAEAAMPGISAYLPAGAGPFQPAVHLAGSSRASFTRATATSTLTAGSQAFTSTVPLAADGGALATLYRTARIMATDPTGAPVLNATVDVRYRSNGTVAALASAPEGLAALDLPATLLQSGAAFMLGQYKLTVSLGATSSDEITFNFPLFPDLSAGSLVLDVPVLVPLYEPWPLAAEDLTPRVVTNATTWVADATVSHNLEIRAPLTLNGINLSLDQTHDFERFIVVTDAGRLDARASRIQSNFAFNIYVLNGTDARFSAGTSVLAAIVLHGAGNVSFDSSRAVGSVIGTAASLNCTSSFVWATRVDLTAGTLRASDCVMAATDVVALSTSGNITLANVGLGTTFEPFEAAKQSALPFESFDAATAQLDTSAAGAPPVRLDARRLVADRVTVWSPQPASLTLGSGSSTLNRVRFVVPSVDVSLASTTLIVEHGAIEGGAPLVLQGTGSVQLRAVLAAAPTGDPAIEVEVYDPVLAHVVDSVGLPVAGAAVRATAVGGGASPESATTDDAGWAELLLLTARTQGGTTQAGPSYRINATRGTSVSPSVTWDAAQPASLEFALPGTFGAISGDASFAVVVPLQSGAWRVIASNLADGSVAGFLSGFTSTLPALDFAAPVFPGGNATLYVAGDFVYAQGPERATLPMAGETATLNIGGAPAASAVLDADGLGTASFSLPGAPGAAAVSLSIPSSRLQAPLTYDTLLTLTALPHLHIEASLSKVNATFKPLEPITIIGTVKDEAGNAIAGARVTIAYGPANTFSRTLSTLGDGSFVFKVQAPADVGAYALRLGAAATDTVSAPETAFPYQVSTTGTIVEPPRPTNVNLVGLVLAAGVFGVGTVVLLRVIAKRRVARGEFVVCGNCEKPILARSTRCEHCGVEFERDLAKCSKCGSWIKPDVPDCPQCHTRFSTEVVADERELGPLIPEPSRGVRDGFDIPESIPLTARRAETGRLEDLEFRLPGTTDTLDLGEKGSAPTFASAPTAAASASAGRRSAPGPAVAPLERMELPRVGESASTVRDVSPGEGGEPTAKEPVSLGNANVDLSRTTAAATGTKPDIAPEDDIPEDVLRELLMKAAPELSRDVLPSEIRKELQEIARSEAPAASEKRAAMAPKVEKSAPPAAPPSVPPSERTAEAPEKSRKTAFDVFSKPTKNIPSGYEKKGQPPTQKELAGKSAPVCPNCGGNWVVQRDGKNSCRVCGTRW